jgi:hypothetical protein
MKEASIEVLLLEHSDYEFVELVIGLISGSLAPSVQTVGSLLRTSWQAKLARKMI